MTSNLFKHDGGILVPPLKWAGGKRWAAKVIKAHIPPSFERYFEPFLGGGAVFFSLAPESAVLSDTNEELVTAYNALRLDWKRVWASLRIHAESHSDSYYYEVRARRPSNPFEIAARLLYLNRTCWNGLYRVNLRGEFNVPRGTKDEVLLETDNPQLISSLLQNAEVICSDFEMSIALAGDGDVIYADPPYTVRHNFNGFLKYNESIFTWNDQERLAGALRAARRRGAHIIISNANHESIRELYASDFELHVIHRSSVIAADAGFRDETSELLIIGEPGRAQAGSRRKGRRVCTRVG